MKFVIQRVNHAEVKVDGEIVGKIGKGFLVLIGVGREDTKEDADWTRATPSISTGKRWGWCSSSSICSTT